MPYQKVELPDIECIKTKIHLSFVYFDRDEVKIPSIGRICPERLFKSLVVGANCIFLGMVCAKDLDIRFTPTTGL
jgi:hypothetical protein